MRNFTAVVGLFVLVLVAPGMKASAEDIPNLVGVWGGTNETVADGFKLKSSPRTVHITEQTDRRFRGHFDYAGGHKEIFGIIFPDNVSFAWVATISKGQVQGRILSPNHIAACYIESGPEATAGCSDLKRTAEKP
ncbi:hypothetical protein [Hyphomicrobium sulfonivorans]|nr:hypothetical protein [Hyphomicrobium sulfonivorans]MBI1650774.1 hypothetical protein [Hyphomicrobium sulfonivorans]